MIRKILKEYGLKPSKRLGQSFLLDRNIMNKIVANLDIGGEDVVVEIGAGLGVMTEIVAAKAKKVIAVDVDPRMIRILRERLGKLAGVEILEEDVLSLDFSAIAASQGVRKVKVIGNVPYNISTQILFRLLEYQESISSAVLLLQKEVVDRITALPGTKDYGIPTVMISLYTVVSREINVPAACFHPQPKVISSLLKMIVREKPLFNVKDKEVFSRLVKAAFAKRRKTLLNNMRNAHGLPTFSGDDLQDMLGRAGIDGHRRGETLSIEEFVRLSNLLSEKKL